MTVREEEVIRKEIKKVFVASDGTEFNCEESCRKYEDSAEGAINAAFKKLKVQASHDVNNDYPYCFGWDDDLYAIKIRNENELKVVNQWLALFNNKVSLGADAIGTIQFVEVYCEGTEAWLMGTPEQAVKRFEDWLHKHYADAESEVSAE